MAFLSLRLISDLVSLDSFTETVEITPEMHKVKSFSFTKYSDQGLKEMEIEGETADILSENVFLYNVLSKAYTDDAPVTITADQGIFDKAESKVRLRQNVIAVTEDGARLLTEVLDIDPEAKRMSTEELARIKKDSLDVEGVGAEGDSNLKQVVFHKDVTVVIQDPDSTENIPTVITCDGPLNIDYEANIAYFYENVRATDQRGQLDSDRMDVFYDSEEKGVDHIIAYGNVIISTPDGNSTYGDKVTYYAKDGRMVMEGDTESVYIPGSSSGGSSILG